MKQRISIMITLCLALTACGSKAETPDTAEITPLKQMIIDEYNARGVQPGMSIDEVKAAEQLTLEEDVARAKISPETTRRYFVSAETCEYDGMPCTVEYSFKDGGLCYISYDTEFEYTLAESDTTGGYIAYNKKKITLADTIGLPAEVEEDDPYPGDTLQFYSSAWTDGDKETANYGIGLNATMARLPGVYDDGKMSDSYSIMFFWDGN